MRFRVLLLLALAVSLSGCAGGVGEEELALTDDFRTAPIEIDIFAARGFLGGSEYERYVLKKDFLWRECGKVLPAAKPAKEEITVEGDRVFPKDPSLEIIQRRVEKVPPEAELKLRVKAAQLYKLRVLDDEKDPPPGSVFSLGQPGVFELSISFGPSKLRVVTSVDAVADKESAALERTNQLFAVLRGIGPTMCEAETFFGVIRAQ